MSFYAFWLLVNTVSCALSLDFLQGVTGGGKRQQMLPWLLLSASITRLVLRYQIPAAFFLSFFVALLFGRCALRRPWRELAPPVAVLFTLSTVLEGFSALAMAWASQTLPSPAWGMAFQALVSLTANAALFLALRGIRIRFFSPGRPPAADLYLLLLPCALLILGLRAALRLDTWGFAPYLCALPRSGTFLLALFLTGSVLLLFLQLQTLYRLLAPARREQALLRETQARTAAFRHDLNSHLLVLSGLLQDREYDRAQCYADTLHRRAAALSPVPPTGRAALDALLAEKLAQAEADGIQVHSGLTIPSECKVNDLDLCALLANLLDNALRACRELPPEQRRLTLQTTLQGKLLLLECANPVDAPCPIVPGTGLQNVRRIARAYQGELQIIQTDTQVLIRVLLASP